MTEIEEKKLVVQWMGYRWEFANKYLKRDKQEQPIGFIRLDDWNPQSDDKATFKEWNEIYEKMDIGEWRLFIVELEREKASLAHPKLYLLTVLPSTRWKALIQMLGER